MGGVSASRSAAPENPPVVSAITGSNMSCFNASSLRSGTEVYRALAWPLQNDRWPNGFGWRQR
jgi:hypothetical protein